MNRRERIAIVFWLCAGFVVWNGVFDLHVSRGVKEYLYRQARHELAGGPGAPVQEVMRRTVADGARAATAWGLLIAAAGLATVRLLPRRSRIPDPESLTSNP